MYVAVKTGVVRVSASKTAKKTASLPYTTKVTLLQEKNGWSYISSDSPRAAGWISSSSLTVKNLQARENDNVSTANAREIALAGKGFNAELEAAYAESCNVDFSIVDKVESFSWSEEKLIKFIKEGELNLQEEE